MRTVTSTQIQELDRIAIEEQGIPSLTLMENAGRVCVTEISKLTPQKICVVCGVGNNGGDGFVMARHLIEQGKDVDVYVVGDVSRMSFDALANYSKLQNVKIDAPVVASADVVVDALFGVGLTRTIEDPFLTAIQEMNAHAKYVLAVDIPSGLDGTTGDIHGVCVQANETVTFTFAKQGMMHSPYCGEIKVKDIGIPKELYARIESKHS